jgi:hypothetical protein
MEAIFNSQQILQVFNHSANGSHVPVYISSDEQVLSERGVHAFTTHDSIKYDPFCNDFGPMNLKSIVQFVQFLDEQIEYAVAHKFEKVAYYATSERRNYTNCSFLLGAYMILKLNHDPRDPSARGRPQTCRAPPHAGRC